MNNTKDFERSIVRIFTANGSVVGEGFLVSERQVLTCAHVVAQALGIPDSTPKPPQAAVTLDFPLVAPGHILTARVAVWQPSRPDGGGDIAGLELRDAPPSGALPVLLVRADDLWKHDLRVFGFPQGFDKVGIWARGKLLGPNAVGWVQIDGEKESGYFVQPGFSGGPVWDDELEGIVGMTVATDAQPGVRVAFIIPADRLIEAWPELARRSSAGEPAEAKKTKVIAVGVLLVGLFAAVLFISNAWRPPIVMPVTVATLTRTLSPASVAASLPTTMPSSTSTVTPSPTATVTPSVTPSPTPTPIPATAVLKLIEKEKQAALKKDMNLIQEIFAPDGTKTDGVTRQSRNAIEMYADTFVSENYIEITHANFNISVTGDAATVINDSCGSFTEMPEGQLVTFNSPQSDQWTFRRDSDGHWWIKDFTYNLVSTAAEHRYSFEDGSNGCWTVRYVDGIAWGTIPTFTTELAHQGRGAIRFAFDFAIVPAHRGQTIVYNMPFAGKASAYVYAPPGAPSDLVAGFFAMELDHAPWNLHDASQMFQLVPGQWTQITWNIQVSGWAQPLHLIGIEVRRVSGGSYRGYVLIDDVLIISR